ncbi:hypothetical protein ACFL3A_04500 [Pseudomonadota bacterium]
MSTSNPPSQENDPATRSDTDHPKSATTLTGRGSPDVVNASSTDGLERSENTGQALVTGHNLPALIPTGVFIFMGSDGIAYMGIEDENNAYALPIGGKAANRVLQGFAHQSGTRLKAYDVKEINEELTAYAEHSGDVRDVYYRCAPFQNGVELDVGNGDRIRITPGKVAAIKKGSQTLFHRTSTMRSLPAPADVGDLKLLDKYLNLHPTNAVLLIAWLSYTLAHPKISTTNFVILVLHGDQGSGKTFLCRIIQALVDPGVVGVQTFPHNQKDLVVAAMNSHVLFYDNMRSITPAMADKLCIAATGGHLTGRRLYTDAEQQVHRLHVALVLNGIHSFIEQPDLAQRSVPLHLLSINEKERRSETEIFRELQADLPMIFRGLLDLIAGILKHLPTVKVTSPERMYDFSQWLAAMEVVDGVPPGTYQSVYSGALNEGMLDSLLENLLGAAVMSFAEDTVDDFWTGTPTELLQELNFRVGKRTPYSKDWPQNPIALSKRLRSLQAGLRRQGINVELSRGKNRKITIVRLEGLSDE